MDKRKNPKGHGSNRGALGNPHFSDDAFVYADDSSDDSTDSASSDTSDTSDTSSTGDTSGGSTGDTSGGSTGDTSGGSTGGSGTGDTAIGSTSGDTTSSGDTSSSDDSGDDDSGDDDGIATDAGPHMDIVTDPCLQNHLLSKKDSLIYNILDFARSDFNLAATNTFDYSLLLLTLGTLTATFPEASLTVQLSQKIMGFLFAVATGGGQQFLGEIASDLAHLESSFLQDSLIQTLNEQLNNGDISPGCLEVLNELTGRSNSSGGGGDNSGDDDSGDDDSGDDGAPVVNKKGGLRIKSTPSTHTTKYLNTTRSQIKMKITNPQISISSIKKR
jgi:hypothetical protein